MAYGDIHAPRQDNECIDLLIKFAKDLNPDIVVDCGDFGMNIWAHDDHEGEPVEAPRKEPRVVVEEPEPEVIRIKRIDARKIAMERYARGLITKEQYNEIMANL